VIFFHSIFLKLKKVGVWTIFPRIMKTKLSCTILSLLIAFTVILPPPRAYAAIPAGLTAASVLVMAEGSSQVIYSRGANLRRQPASTTKVLTALTAIEHLPMDRIVTIPKFIESVEPSKIHLKAGEQYYVRDLVSAALISSANDAAEALAYFGGDGSREEFANRMNAKARSVGANNSNFIRSSGLPAEGQYSTAHDMAMIMKNAYQYPFIVEALKRKGMSIQSLAGRKIYLRNHNKMLWRDSRELVGKTGWTRLAKHCFVGYIRGSSKVYFFAMLGSNSLWGDLKKILDSQTGSTLSVIHKNRKIWGRTETKRIQAALRRAGYVGVGTPDGRWGPRTVEAVVKFQQAHGISADGIVGEETRKKLFKYQKKTTSKLKQVQLALKKAGYNPGRVDGILGAKSKSALKAFQRANGLSPDGVVGSFTWEKLQRYL
jgi:D-alanyl-D-alanine carboxypeptidase (penicillin-binding protein 5/6)